MHLSLTLAFALHAAAAPPGATKAAPLNTSCILTAESTQDMRACAGRERSQADKHLNAAYRDVLRYVGGDEREQLVKVQRAWLAFRDADCAFMGGGGGSLAPVNEDICRAGLSETRAKELETWPPNSTRDALNPLR